MLLLAALFCATARAEQPELAAVGVYESQGILGKGGSSVVAILDAGVDASHPALIGRELLLADFCGAGSVDDGAGGAGHGTGVLSILVGQSGSFLGAAPDAAYISVRAMVSGSVYAQATFADALFFAARNGANVVNLSIGYAVSDPENDKAGLILDYVAAKWGVLGVIAAGNDADSAYRQTPSGAYSAIAVGAVDATYAKVAGFSDRTLASDPRSKPDLVAPGVNVMAAAANWETSADYYAATGTSFAAPIVAGVAGDRKSVV